MRVGDGVWLAGTRADGTSRVIQSPVINTVPGALKIQEVFTNFQWAYESADSPAYAVHLRRAPLPGIPPKSVLVNFGKGDLQVPNPVTTALLRASDLADRATFYR